MHAITTAHVQHDAAIIDGFDQRAQEMFSGLHLRVRNRQIGIGFPVTVEIMASGKRYDVRFVPEAMVVVVFTNEKAIGFSKTGFADIAYQ